MKTTTTRIERNEGAVNDLDLVETFEQTKAALEAVEKRLAERLQLALRRNVRGELIARARQGKLVEDELVARWHELYASYMDSLREESWAEPPPKPLESAEPRAAEAALAALWGGRGADACRSLSARRTAARRPRSISMSVLR